MSDEYKVKYGSQEIELEDGRKALVKTDQPVAPRVWKAGEIAHQIEHGIDGPNYFVERQAYDRAVQERDEMAGKFQQYAVVLNNAAKEIDELKALSEGRLQELNRFYELHREKDMLCENLQAEVERLTPGVFEMEMRAQELALLQAKLDRAVGALEQIVEQAQISSANCDTAIARAALESIQTKD